MMENAESGDLRSSKRRIMRYGAELLVVFVGVWLSLLAENWREERSASRTERSSVTRMAQDLSSDLDDLRVNLLRAEPGVTHGRWLLARGGNAGASIDSLTRALSAIQFTSVFVENTGEYEALRNAGQLGIISDAELRRRIVALYESRRLIRSVHERDHEFTRATFDLMAAHVLVKEPPEAALGQAAADGFYDSSRPRVTAVPGRDVLLEDRAFRSHLTQLVAFRHFLVTQILAQIRETQALRDELLGRLR